MINLLQKFQHLMNPKMQCCYCTRTFRKSERKSDWEFYGMDDETRVIKVCPYCESTDITKI